MVCFCRSRPAVRGVFYMSEYLTDGVNLRNTISYCAFFNTKNFREMELTCNMVFIIFLFYTVLPCNDVVTFLLFIPKHNWQIGQYSYAPGLCI